LHGDAEHVSFAMSASPVNEIVAADAGAAETSVIQPAIKMAPMRDLTARH